jgi:hypothetical protein
MPPSCRVGAGDPSAATRRYAKDSRRVLVVTPPRLGARDSDDS